ncbi:uncharacterized protein LOC110455144 isoform X3 [Mizuhopecten yessoensis]|uniref:uncharacterized protein LOC110455144 isoform X3 n=1 Tax=Mizuhopecten yessoensis TaxID=6573 RepID=UPI000B459273|nr:uncharacterized protein LOC110455144 isoform X3 [Mizuhopecten yessoensis]
MDDKDDIDDEDDDKPSFSSNMSGPPSLARRVGNMTGSTSVAYLSPMDRMDSKELLFSLLFTTSTDQPSSRFSSSVGRHATPYDDPDEYFSTPTSLPPPPTVKATSEGHSQPKEEETVRDLEIKIEELQARLVEKKMLEKKEQLPSSVNNSVQGRSSDSSDNNDYDTIVKVERSNSNEGQEEWKKPSEKAGDSRDVVIENNVHAPFISANAKEVPISKLLKKDSFNKIKFNQEDFLNSILSSPQTSVKRVSEGEGTGACKIPPHAKKHGIGISNKDMQPIPKQIADGVIKDFKSAGRFEEGIGRNVDSGWETIEEGVFENKFLETDIPQEVVEIALPPDPNIPHTRSRRTEGYDYTEQNSFDFDRMNPIDSKSNSVDNFQNENIPGKTLSTNENCPDSRNQSMYSKESVEYSDLPPLKYPDHSPINPPSTAGDGQNPLLSNLSNEKSGHSTQLPPKKKSQEMTSLSGENFTFTSELNKDDISGYQEFTNSTKISYSNKVTGNSSLHTVPRYASYMSSLQSLSDHHGFVIKDVTPDGNCMFSAIVDQLRIQGNFDLTPNSLRKTAVEYLRANPKNQDGTHLESFLSTETWLEYLNRMGQESQWGDHMVLQACTEVTGQRIVVFKPNTNKTVLVPTAEESLENTSLTLGHIGESHFVSLRPKDWETNWPLMAHAHRAKMKEKQKLARKKIREIKKSKKQKKTPEPTVSNKEDSTSADEKGKETGSEKGETGSEKAKEAGSEKGKETGSEKGETGSGTGETESGTGETESGTGETGSGTGETESGTEVTETEGATQEVVKEKEPDKDEDDDSDEEEVESDDSQFKTTDDNLDLMSDDLDLVLHPVAIDANSGIPLPHLSFLLRQIVKPSFLYMDIPKNVTTFSDPDIKPYPVGSIAEGLCVHFVDYSDPQHPRMPATDTPTVIGVCSRSCVRSESELKINDMDLIADTALTHPGYLHLVPDNERLYPNMVTYIEKKPFLAHMTLATPEKGSVYELMLRKTFTGYRCASWPDCAMEWLSRSRPSRWPGNEIFQKVMNTECLVMSRGHPNCLWPNIEYQFVFPQAEHILAKEALSDDQLHCFNAFKTLVDFSLRNYAVKLGTTHLKSVMYSACETIPLSCWGNNSGGCLVFLLESLLQKLQTRNIPNYFISQNNMVGHFSEGTLQVLVERVAIIRTFPVMVLYHIMEHHELGLSCLASMVLDDMPRFCRHRQFNRTVREAFVPAVLYLAKLYIYDRKIEAGYVTAQDAYSELLMQVPEEDALENDQTEDTTDCRSQMQKIMHDMIKKEPKDFQHFLAHHLDLGLGTSLIHDLYKGTDMKTISHLIGKEASGTLAFKPIPPGIYGDIHKELSYLDKLAYEFFNQNKMDLAVSVLRGGIQKGKSERQSSVIDVSDITDSHVKKDIARQTYSMMTTYNSLLAEMYSHLFVCYSKMNSVALFQENIEEYEELCDMIGSPDYYEDVANIWNTLGNVERSRKVRHKMNALSS